MTRYVNNSGSAQVGPSGNWGIGSDANAGTSISAPKETFNAAVTAVSNGENIILWDGTYKDGDYTLASKVGVSIDAENAYQVTIQNSNAADDRVFASNTTTDNIKFGQVIIDCEGMDHAYRSSGTGITQRFIFDGTKIINSSEEAVRNHATTVFTGSYHIESAVADETVSTAAVHWDPDTAGQTLILGGQGRIIFQGAPTSLLVGVWVTPDATVDNSNVYIEDGLSIELIVDGASTIPASGVLIGAAATLAGYGNIYIGDIDVGITGTQSPTGTTIIANATYGIDNLVIKKPAYINRSVDTITPSGGYGINIGGEFDAAGGDVIGARLVTALSYGGATVTGFDHGEYFGGLSDKNLAGGGLTKQSVISRILEGCSNVNLSSGVVINPQNTSNGQCLRIKECINSEIEQNTVIVTDTGYLGSAIEERDATVASTGNAFRNNNIILPAGLTGTPKFVNSSSLVTAQATFANNHYYKGGDAFASTDFDDQGSGVNLTGWQAAVEATAFSSATNGTILSTGNISYTSSLIDAGSTSATVATDFNGRFFGVARRTVGAFTENSTPTSSSGSGRSIGILGSIIGRVIR